MYRYCCCYVADLTEVADVAVEEEHFIQKDAKKTSDSVTVVDPISMLSSVKRAWLIKYFLWLSVLSPWNYMFLDLA